MSARGQEFPSECSSPTPTHLLKTQRPLNYPQKPTHTHTHLFSHWQQESIGAPTWTSTLLNHDTQLHRELIQLHWNEGTLSHTYVQDPRLHRKAVYLVKRQKKNEKRSTTITELVVVWSLCSVCTKSNAVILLNTSCFPCYTHVSKK